MEAAELRSRYGEPSDRAVRKELDHIDGYCRQFIAMSPFVVLGTSDALGRQDVSPRGDPPGFVRVLDEHTLLIPDRPGNRRIDSMLNIAANPRVGLLFMVPGFEETVRVNGRASVTTDEVILAASAVDGRAPRSGLLIDVEEAYFHCGKALIRSGLWKPEAQVERAVMPGLGRIIAEQIGEDRPEEADAVITKAYREALY